MSGSNFSSCAYFNSIIEFVNDKSDNSIVNDFLIKTISTPDMINNNLFISDSTRLNKGNCEFPISYISKEIQDYGGCSLMAERVVVVRKTGVRFTSSALNLFKKDWTKPEKKQSNQRRMK